MIMTGSGRAVVCAVGDNTRLSRNRTPQDLIIKEQSTYLEEKLEDLAKTISKYALIVTGIIITTQTVFTVALILFDGDINLMSNETILRISKIIIISVCMLIVAIPEGLPLAVSIAMALSISKLKDD
jgi:P-type Ca2+ transporter type 2C